MLNFRAKNTKYDINAFSIVDFNKLNVAKLTAIVFDITKTGPIPA